MEIQLNNWNTPNISYLMEPQNLAKIGNALNDPDPNKILKAFIKLIYFHPDHPENYSIKITDKNNLEKVEIYNNGELGMMDISKFHQSLHKDMKNINLNK